MAQPVNEVSDIVDKACDYTPQFHFAEKAFRREESKKGDGCDSSRRGEGGDSFVEERVHTRRPPDPFSERGTVNSTP